MRVAIIGAGAAGHFCAIRIKEELIERGEDHTLTTITLFEKGSDVLRKVRISGGGRCNVTHNQFDPKLLASNYPRGSRELRGPFNSFNPSHMIEWLNRKGVKTKVESDGRIFPVTDSSQTIIDCFKGSIINYGIDVKLSSAVKNIELNDSGQFLLSTSQEDPLVFDYLVITTGSDRSGHFLAGLLGHAITPLAPSLFTFKVKSPLLLGLEGISFPSATIDLKLGKKKWQEKGPLLITHWGLSGPAILKLSAWAAREIKEHNYQFDFRVNFLGLKLEEITERLKTLKAKEAKKLITNTPLDTISKRFWKVFVNELIPEDCERPWIEVSQKSINKLSQALYATVFKSVGSHRFKEEFVECGGINSKEIDFKTMQSKIVPNLYFAGEVLDIDGITGGFNFQNAWTGAFLAAQSLAKKD
ncbi:MAG: NAD(P)/FAD-dependent oxidoreductase [Bdellovibrionota bacterium]|nr:NAD(P)/FAD-dependent oxidoreductase [Bdellovibrionota bacterium]